jgi:oligopeptidase B
MDRLAAMTTGDEGGDGEHPAMPRFVFIESGLGDPRVPHWEPMAFAARLRDYNSKKAQEGEMRCQQQKRRVENEEDIDHDEDVPSQPLVLHKCNLQAGHGGASGRYEQLRELADEYAFVVAAAYQP